MTKKKNKDLVLGDILLGILFLLCLLFLNIFNLLIKDKKVSLSENRTLAEKPVMTVDSLVRGDYEEQLETYLSDQFAFREGFRKMNNLILLAGGNRLQNHIFYGKDGQLFREIDSPDMRNLQANMEAINRLSVLMQHTDKKIYLMLVPDAAAIYPECLPPYAETLDEAAAFEKIKGQLAQEIVWIDGLSAMLKHKKEQLYYKTDHHWTTYGAYCMYRETKGQFAFPEESEEYDIFPVTNRFNGVLSGNSGFAGKEREEIDVYLPKNNTDLVVSYVEEQKKRSSLYEVEKLNTRDQYGVFLGGNHSLLDIRTAADSDRTLLLFKDSFANCYIPFLVSHYKEIVVVDPRYYAGTITDLLGNYNIQEILFLYSGNTFLTDNHITGMMDIS